MGTNCHKEMKLEKYKSVKKTKKQTNKENKQTRNKSCKFNHLDNLVGATVKNMERNRRQNRIRCMSERIPLRRSKTVINRGLNSKDSYWLTFTRMPAKHCFFLSLKGSEFIYRHAFLSSCVSPLILIALVLQSIPDFNPC